MSNENNEGGFGVGPGMGMGIETMVSGGIIHDFEKESDMNSRSCGGDCIYIDNIHTYNAIVHDIEDKHLSFSLIYIQRTRSHTGTHT